MLRVKRYVLHTQISIASIRKVCTSRINETDKQKVRTFWAKHPYFFHTSSYVFATNLFTTSYKHTDNTKKFATTAPYDGQAVRSTAMRTKDTGRA